MEIRATAAFVRWFQQIEDPELARLVNLLRRALTRLPERPTEPTAHLTPVVQATRHNIWRIKHAHKDGYAVRLLLWLPDDNDDEIVIVFAGNKHPNHEHWYDRAIRETEAAVDHLIRQRPTSSKE
jgi:hypothetical protein